MIRFERHHKFWPKKNYINGKLSRVFRNLPCNIELITHEEHSEIHAQDQETPGGKPNHDFMSQQISDCFTRGCTKSHCKIAVGKQDIEPKEK
jgi:hypothetical protein